MRQGDQCRSYWIPDVSLPETRIPDHSSSLKCGVLDRFDELARDMHGMV
jgi:hypothetical protein